MELPYIALASKALRETVALLTDDVRLARTEAGEIIDRVEGGAKMIAAAAVILIPAVVLLFAGAAALVEKEGLSRWWLFWASRGFGRDRSLSTKPRGSFGETRRFSQQRPLSTLSNMINMKTTRAPREAVGI